MLVNEPRFRAVLSFLFLNENGRRKPSSEKRQFIMPPAVPAKIGIQIEVKQVKVAAAVGSGIIQFPLLLGNNLLQFSMNVFRFIVHRGNHDALRIIALAWLTGYPGL
jgi:hypothetical protein